MNDYKVFYKLDPAIQSRKQGEYIWAEDVPHSRGSKRYILANRITIYKYCQMVRTPSLYEVITNCTKVKLYMDIELDCQQLDNESLNIFQKQYHELFGKKENALLKCVLTNYNKPFNESDCRKVNEIMLTCVRYAILSMKPSHDPPDITILSACRRTKISFHYIVQNMILDSHETSMVFIMYEIRYY